MTWLSFVSSLVKGHSNTFGRFLVEMKRLINANAKCLKNRSLNNGSAVCGDGDDKGDDESFNICGMDR